MKDFNLSETTFRRAKKKAIKENAMKYRNEVKQAADSAKYPLIAHFDGKIMIDRTEGKNSEGQLCCSGQY